MYVNLIKARFLGRCTLCVDQRSNECSGELLDTGSTVYYDVYCVFIDKRIGFIPLFHSHKCKNYVSIVPTFGGKCAIQN
jgi:hypothetical protein